MVPHSRTKNLKDLEIELVFLIVSKILNSLYFFGTEIAHKRPIKSLKICQIVPNLNISNHYHSHIKSFLLIADISTD